MDTTEIRASHDTCYDSQDPCLVHQLCDEIDRLRAELATATAQRDIVVSEREHWRVTAEANETSADAIADQRDAARAEVERLTAERQEILLLLDTAHVFDAPIADRVRLLMDVVEATIARLTAENAALREAVEKECHRMLADAGDGTMHDAATKAACRAILAVLTPASEPEKEER